MANPLKFTPSGDHYAVYFVETDHFAGSIHFFPDDDEWKFRPGNEIFTFSSDHLSQISDFVACLNQLLPEKAV